MKKIFTTALLSLACLAAGAQSLVINFTDGSKKTFDANSIANVTFSPENFVAPADLSGNYDCQLDVTIPAMPNMGVVVSEDTKFSLTATDKEGCYNVILPSCLYNTMTLPAVTVKNVEFTQADGSFSFSTEFSGTDDSGKAYSGNLSGSFSDKDSFTITETLKYGSMPFDLQMQYSPKAVTE